MIVEVVAGAEERPEARVVDIDDLSRLHLAARRRSPTRRPREVLQRAGLGRMEDGDTARPGRRGAARRRRAARDGRRLGDAVGRDGRARAQQGLALRRTARASGCTWRALRRTA